MKTRRRSFPFTFGLLLLGAGCGSIEVAPSGKPDRVLTGTINAGVALPADTEVVVRLVAAPGATDSLRPTGDAPLVNRPTGPAVERVLGEQSQKLTEGTREPVAFRIEYSAEDAVLRRGLNVEARVSFGGRLRFRTINAHVVTLASSAYRQDVAVQPVER